MVLHVSQSLWRISTPWAQVGHRTPVIGIFARDSKYKRVSLLRRGVENILQDIRSISYMICSFSLLTNHSTHQFYSIKISENKNRELRENKVKTLFTIVYKKICSGSKLVISRYQER
jgi:hypothetical protein